MSAMDNGISGCLLRADRDHAAPYIVAVVLLLLLAFSLGAKQSVGPVRGSCFILVDDKGVERATLTWENGTMLNLCNEKGDSQIMLTVDKQGAMVSLRSPAGETGAMLAAGRTGNALVFPNADGKLAGVQDSR